MTHAVAARFGTLEAICIDDIEIKSFRVSCASDAPDDNGKLDVIGVLFLKCRDGSKTIHGGSIRPGYVHLKNVPELEKMDNSKFKTLHHLCFESIFSGKLEDCLVMGFGVNYGNMGIKLNSSTFNTNLSNHLDKSSAREAMEFFTPIIQTIMRKYKIEKCVGFDVPVEYVPLRLFDILAGIYPNKHLQAKRKKKEFDTMEKFCQWCRIYYAHGYNRESDFREWFIRGMNTHTIATDLDHFYHFGIV